jgi:hypothetical protein
VFFKRSFEIAGSTAVEVLSAKKNSTKAKLFVMLLFIKRNVVMLRLVSDSDKK